jgi:hypothetical protein
MNYRLRLTTLVLLLFLIGQTSWAERVEPYSEYQAKSGLLFSICKFVNWPLLEPDQPFVISVLGTMPGGGKIYFPEQFDMGEKVHDVKIRYIKRLSEIKNSNVLFITASESHRIDDILDFVQGKPILTVGESKGLGQKGVIINFFLKEKGFERANVGFEINHEASKKASLQLHSRLNNIGKRVKTRKSRKKRET